VGTMIKERGQLMNTLNMSLALAFCLAIGQQAWSKPESQVLDFCDVTTGQVKLKDYRRVEAGVSFYLLYWSPDDSWLLGREVKGNKRNVGLWVINAKSGEKRKLVEGPTKGVTWSPDGKKIAYVGWDGPVCVLSFTKNDFLNGKIRKIRTAGKFAKAYDLHWGEYSRKFHVRESKKGSFGFKTMDIPESAFGTTYVDDAPVIDNGATGLLLKHKRGNPASVCLPSCISKSDVMVIDNEKIRVPVFKGRSGYRLPEYIEIDFSTGQRRYLQGAATREPDQEWVITCAPSGDLYAQLADTSGEEGEVSKGSIWGHI